MERQVELFDVGYEEPKIVVLPASEPNADVMSVLQSICRYLTRDVVDMKMVVEKMMAGIVRLTASTACNVYMIEDGSTICLIANEPGGLQFKYSTMVVGKFFGHGNSMRVIISNDVKSDPRSNHCLPESHHTIKTFMAIPMIYEGDCIGKLILANKDKYTLDDALNMVYLAPTVAAVLYKYRHYKASDDVERVAEVNGAKDRFLATMSHELRTPLNGITAMITMLPDAGPLNEKQKEYVKLLTECTFQLTNLLNNILDFSKMAANCLVLGKTPFTIEQAISDAIIMTNGKAVAKGIKIDVGIPPDLPSVVGDSQRVTQVLANLLSNAVKFTEKGSIKVTVKAEKVDTAEYSKKWKLIFSVQDTGMGIDIEEQERIFDTFQQSASLSTYLSKSGTGLGLSISRELVRLMDGQLTVFSSGRDQGSTFSFFILIDEEIHIDTLQNTHSELFSGANIIVVDDRTEIRIQLYNILKQWGCKPSVFASAEEALMDVRHDMRYKVALVDIHMPYMSGIDLAKTLRSEFPQLPLIGISSVDIEGGSAYFDYYMFKPVDQNQLFPAILQCLLSPPSKSNKVVSGCVEKRRRKYKKNLRILIAEDDSYNAYACKEMLLNIGFAESNIHIVPDGKKCVDRLKVDKFDVVLMDLVMPIMSGFEATRHIRQMKCPPLVIAISAAVQNSDREKCQQVGIDCYLAKPLLKETLRTALAPLVRKK